jgi:Calcium binding
MSAPSSRPVLRAVCSGIGRVIQRSSWPASRVDRRHEHVTDRAPDVLTFRRLCVQARVIMVCGQSPARMKRIAMVEWFGRPEIETNEVRERRISMEAVVDAYNEQERAIGWYYYLEMKINFPFLARCAARRSTSPLRVGDEVEVIGMAPVEDCEHDMFVEMDLEEEELAVPSPSLKLSMPMRKLGSQSRTGSTGARRATSSELTPCY